MNLEASYEVREHSVQPLDDACSLVVTATYSDKTEAEPLNCNIIEVMVEATVHLADISSLKKTQSSETQS